MKKKLDFNITLKGLNQQPLMFGDNTMLVAKSLAFNISNTIKGDAVKFYSWGVELERDGTLELDPSDIELLKSTVNAFEIASLIKAQILLVING